MGRKPFLYLTFLALTLSLSWLQAQACGFLCWDIVTDGRADGQFGTPNSSKSGGGGGGGRAYTNRDRPHLFIKFYVGYQCQQWSAPALTNQCQRDKQAIEKLVEEFQVTGLEITCPESASCSEHDGNASGVLSIRSEVPFAFKTKTMRAKCSGWQNNLESTCQEELAITLEDIRATGVFAVGVCRLGNCHSHDGEAHATMEIKYLPEPE